VYTVYIGTDPISDLNEGLIHETFSTQKLFYPTKKTLKCTIMQTIVIVIRI